MSVDFRCEKCGRLLSLDAEPGSTTRCPHCGARLTVPEGLASLPRPQVPGAQRPAQPTPPVAAAAEPAGADAADEEEGEGEEESAAVLTVMSRVMPVVMSLFLHAALLLIMALIPMLKEPPREPESVYVPDATESDDLRLMQEQQPRQQAQQTQRRQARQSYAKAPRVRDRVVAVQAGHMDPTGGGTADLLGSGSGEGSIFGPPGDGGGGGNIRQVVFVIDRSGSMQMEGVAGPRIEHVKRSMVEFIGQLSPQQDFHIVTFADGEGPPLEGPGNRMMAGSDDNAIEASEWLANMQTGRGPTNPIPALKRAFAVLRQAGPARKGQKWIYLLTDGEFGGPGNEAVREAVAALNKDKSINVSTWLYSDPQAADYKDARAILWKIANENGGTLHEVGAR